MKKILDIRVTRDRKTKTLRLDQSHYLNEVLDRLHMLVGKHSLVKLSMNDYDSLRLAKSNDERIDQRNYQHAIGNIMYAAIHTRLDIAFAIERLSQYLVDLAKHHDQTLKALLRYLRFIVDKELMYNNNESSCLVAYSNSNYVANRLDRKSILDYVFMMSEEPIA